MKNWTPSRSLRLSRFLNLTMILLAIFALFCIPICTEWYDAVSTHDDDIHHVLNVVFYLSDVLALLCFLKLDRLLNNILKQEIFIEANVAILRLISWCCFGICAAFLFLTFYRPISLIVAVAAGFFGLILRVLKNVFELAVMLREEQDYTI